MTGTNFTPRYTVEQRNPQAHGSKGRAFVIFSLVHTITDLIPEILRSNPDILMHGHLFNDIEAQPFQGSNLGSWTMDTRDEQPLKFLQHMLGCSSRVVGFMSRPEDWRNRSEVLQQIVGDPAINKVVVTGDPLRSFMVCCKKLEREELYSPKLSLSPQGIQRFIDGVKKEEQYFRDLLGSAQVLWLNHNDFLSDMAQTFKKLFRHLGVPPVGPHSNEEVKVSELCRLEKEFCFVASLKLRTTKHRYDLIRDSFNLEDGPARAELPIGSQIAPKPLSSTKKLSQWALLVPVQSTDGKYEWGWLEAFFQTLTESLPTEDLERLVVHFGVDEDDILSTMLSTTVSKMANGIRCPKTILTNIKKGHVCKIWRKLADVAVRDGCDFFVLLGDDITFEGYNWMASIEGKFRELYYSNTSLRFGVGCVAFNDLSFPHFPSFPVLHRAHIDIFGELFSSRFINQGGDPFLFELYSRVGAAVIDYSAKIRNGIGGNSASRYEKRSIRFKNAILSETLGILEDEFGEESVLPSLDVVVPTYRLNFGILDRILHLRVSRRCKVNFWVVVDRPEHPRVSELQTMYDGKSTHPNHRIQVLVHPENLGASAARNTGMMRSCADWIVLFDDDVCPEENILDQYLAATFRYPNADAFAGVTRMPKAVSWWQKALQLSRITYFYLIASRMTHVPWSVTANLCVKGRTNEGVMFRLDYPKSGGGEDVDFCFRLKKDANGIVAVPNAVVHHPWFGNNALENIKHVMKWVTGDSRCVEMLPQHTYAVYPGWTEFLMLASIPAISYGIFFKLAFLVICVEIIFKSVAFLKTDSTDTSETATAVSAFFASLILMGQEAIRTSCHVRRMSPRALCRRLDWFDGMNQEATALSKRQHALKFAVYAVLFCHLALM